MTSLNADILLDLLTHLVRDVEDILGFEGGTFDQDLLKISTSVKSRGLRVLLVDLPSLCSSLERGLESGVIDTSTDLFGTRSVPRIFTSIFLNIFTEEGNILDEPNPLSVACLRQIFKCLKKLRVDPPDAAVKEKILEFRRIEEDMATPNLSWGDSSLVVTGQYPSLVDLGTRLVSTEPAIAGNGSDLSGTPEDSELFRDLSFVQRAADLLLRSFQFRSQWFRPKHGPGAVSERFENSKFEFPSWPERLESHFPFSEWGLANLSFWDHVSPEFDSKESPSKLIGVPKDFKGPRLIASEPISSQYIQQGFLSLLRENVKRSPLRYTIDFLSQAPSRELALKASASRDFSTIDLSSASDRLSCAVVECFFRRNYRFMEMLNSARTHTLMYADGDVVQMKKFAAQGAAFTFPIQSIIYAICCAGVIYADKPQSRWSDIFKVVRVFGDDMIVPTAYFDRIVRVLESIGLKVNREKSFSKGFFRESCGMDAYMGVEVTSTSILELFNIRSPASTVSVLECSNNLYLGGYIRASKRLLETIPWKIRKNIPWVGRRSTVDGALGSGRNHLPTRWNKTLFHEEVKILVIENKVSMTAVDGHFRLFQWFQEKPLPDTVWKSGHAKSVKASYRLRWVPSYKLGM